MTKLHLTVAAAAIALAPALTVSTLALAQSAISDPSVPGSGYRIPEMHQTAQVPRHSADNVDLSTPGDGYRIPEMASPTAQVPQHSADDVDLSAPGDGYRIPDMASPTAPGAPVMNDNGTYPSHSRHD